MSRYYTNCRYQKSCSHLLGLGLLESLLLYRGDLHRQGSSITRSKYTLGSTIGNEQYNKQHTTVCLFLMTEHERWLSVCRKFRC